MEYICLRVITVNASCTMFSVFHTPQENGVCEIIKCCINCDQCELLLQAAVIEIMDMRNTNLSTESLVGGTDKLVIS